MQLAAPPGHANQKMNMGKNTQNIINDMISVLGSYTAARICICTDSQMPFVYTLFWALMRSFSFSPFIVASRAESDSACSTRSGAPGLILAASSGCFSCTVRCSEAVQKLFSRLQSNNFSVSLPLKRHTQTSSNNHEYYIIYIYK